MALRGETIGTAYVRILADGSGLGDDIRRELRANDDEFRQAGEDSSRAYIDGFRKEVKKEGRQDRSAQTLSRALARGAGRFDAVGELFGDHLLDGLRNELEDRFPNDVGSVIFNNLKQQLDRGEIDFSGLVAKLKNIRPEVSKATRELMSEQERITREHVRRQTEAFEDLGRAIEDYGAALIKTRPHRRRLIRDLAALQAILPETVTNTDLFRRRVAQLDQILRPAGGRLALFRQEVVKINDVIARGFGRGSRNDFLNFFGGFVTLLPRVLGGIGRVTTSLGALVRQFQAASQAAGGGPGGFLAALGGLARAGIPGLAAAALAAVGVITSLSVVLPTLAAAVVGVTGIVLALAGSLSFALVGGLVAVAGALVPFAAGLGVAVLAISGLNKENKAVKQNLKELKNEFKDLQRIAANGLFGKDGAGLDNITVLLEAIEPIVKSVSKALGDLLDQLGETAKTKGFRDLMKDLSVILPPLVTTIGRISGNLGIGLIQAFIALEPYVTRFLGWMEQVSIAFRDFGKDDGARGGSGLARFLDAASASAMRLWDLIVQVGNVLSTVFVAGKSTGDNIITKLADAAEDLNKWLTSPEGRQALQDMFTFAEQLADAFGRIVLAVIKFIDALDTPTSRKVLLDILGLIEQIINALAVGAGWLNRWLEFTTSMGQGWKDVFAGVEQAVDGAIEAFGRIKDYVVNILIPDLEDIWASMTLGDLVTRTVLFFEDLTRGIMLVLDEFFRWWDTAWDFLPDPVELVVRSLLGPWQWLYDQLVGNSIIPDLIDEIVRLFGTLPGRIAGLLSPILPVFVTWLAPLVPAATQKVSEIAKSFTGLASKIISNAGDIAGKFGTWVAGLPGKARTNASNIADAYKGLAGKIIERAGSIASRFADWISGLPGRASRNASSIANQYSGLAGDAVKKMGSLADAMGPWGRAAVREANSIANGIVDEFSGLGNQIENAIGPINIHVNVDTSEVSRARNMAAGGLVNRASLRVVGEAGPEAVVPLARPLSQVDPSVRMLSAFAQGKLKEKDLPTNNTRSLADVDITVITPTKDPVAVAAEVFNRLAAASYV